MKQNFCVYSFGLDGLRIFFFVRKPFFESRNETKRNEHVQRLRWPLTDWRSLPLQKSLFFARPATIAFCRNRGRGGALSPLRCTAAERGSPAAGAGAMSSAAVPKRFRTTENPTEGSYVKITERFTGIETDCAAEFSTDFSAATKKKSGRRRKFSFR